jgi:hypothetical protein
MRRQVARACAEAATSRLVDGDGGGDHVPSAAFETKAPNRLPRCNRAAPGSGPPGRGQPVGGHLRGEVLAPRACMWTHE